MFTFSYPDCCSNHPFLLIILIYGAVSFSWGAVGLHQSPLCSEALLINQSPFSTNQFTSATSKKRLVFGNIVWRSSSFSCNVPTDSTNLSRAWNNTPTRLYYNTAGIQKPRTGWEVAIGSSQDKLACSQSTVGGGSLPACGSL